MTEVPSFRWIHLHLPWYVHFYRIEIYTVGNTAYRPMLKSGYMLAGLNLSCDAHTPLAELLMHMAHNIKKCFRSFPSSHHLIDEFCRISVICVPCYLTARLETKLSWWHIPLVVQKKSAMFTTVTHSTYHQRNAGFSKICVVVYGIHSLKCILRF